MKLLILDRDGTLNRSRDDYVASPDEWEPLPGALEAVARLNQGGWRVVLATNQSGIGRSLFDMAALNAIHAKMHRQLAAVGARVAPRGARISVRVEGDTVVAMVEADVPLLPMLDVSARSVAAREPQAEDLAVGG